jgi:hypothetical protein
VRDFAPRARARIRAGKELTPGPQRDSTPLANFEPLPRDRANAARASCGPASTAGRSRDIIALGLGRHSRDEAKQRVRYEINNADICRHFEVRAHTYCA